MTNPDLLSSEEAEKALRALQQSSRPMNLTNLWKAIPKSARPQKNQLAEILNELAISGQIRAHLARPTVYWLPSLEEQASKQMLQAFGEKPLTQTELKNRFKSPLKGWPVIKREEMLAQLVEEKRVCKLSSVYWLPGIEQQASERILEAFSEQPLTQSKLNDKLRSLLVGWPEAKRKEMLARLIEEKRVYELPPVTGRAKFFSTKSDDPDYLRLVVDHFQGELKKLSAKLEARGVMPEQIRAALRELLQQNFPELAPTSNLAAPIAETRPLDEIGQLILERMQRIDPAAARGSLVSLTELRRSLSAEIPDKEDFDQAVLRLVEQDHVALSRHVFPSNLSQEERDMLVSDERGNYYVGIALTT